MVLFRIVSAKDKYHWQNILESTGWYNNVQKWLRVSFYIYKGVGYKGKPIY